MTVASDDSMPVPFFDFDAFCKQKGDDMTSQCQKGNAVEIRHNQLQ